MRKLEDMLRENVGRWHDRDYLYEKADGVYRAVTYGEFLDNVRNLAAWLLKQGLEGKRVMIYGGNSIRLMAADLAVLHYVGVSVCVPKDWGAADVAKAAGRLDISCILYDPRKQQIINEVRGKMPSLVYVCMERFPEIFRIPSENFGHPEDAMTKDGERGFGLCPPRDEEICCKIVFSGGTTSRPKAVMLSKKNIFAGLDSLYRRCPLDDNDVDYLFLPLSHTYGGIYNFLYSLVFGFRIYLCSDTAAMAQELQEVNPTIFCGVPLIYRRFYEQCGEGLAAAFGSRIKYLFCGGAHFDGNIRKAYRESGLNMMEAYGLSETASTFSIQYPGDEDTESVGTVAEELKVRILEPDGQGVGEIAVKGDNVFLGYAGEPKLTEAVFTEDGYFRTGDKGFLRPDERHGGSRLYLVGRIRRMLVGENGEKVEPTHIERLICERDANISRTLVCLEEGRPACEIYLTEPEERDWEGFFEELNRGLPFAERIRRWHILSDSGGKRWKQ